MRKPTFRERVFQSYWRIRRPATLGVRGVVVDSSGKVLLLRHTYTPGWHFPGGGVEQGETCAYALARELEEEAGIRADTGAFELVSVHANHAFFPNDHVLVYRITAWTQGEATQKGRDRGDPLRRPPPPPRWRDGGHEAAIGRAVRGQTPGRALVAGATSGLSGPCFLPGTAIDLQ